MLFRSATKRKDKLVKKLKKKFGVDLGEEGTTEEAEEISDDEDEEKGEDELEQGPLQLTQSLGEDKNESAKEEKAEEAPIKEKFIKRIAKVPLAPQPKPKKVAQPTPKKLTNKATTRATTIKEKEEAAKRNKITKKMIDEPNKRRKFVAQLEFDEEKTESDDNS